MKEIDEFDKKIENILKADIYEPISYTNTIMHALDKKNRRKVISFPKLVAAIIAGAMLISGVVYAKQIGEFIKRFFNQNNGVDTAVGYGYVQNINKEFISNSDTNVKIIDFLMDDYNIDFTLDISCKDSIKEVVSLIIPDMIIYDENLNILYCKGKENFTNFCNKNNLNLDYHAFNENRLNTTVYKSQTYQENYLSFNIKSLNSYPKSKKIFIEFSNIIITNIYGEENQVQDSWKTEIDVIEDFYNRKTVNYDVLETNEPAISNFKFETFSTGTILKIDAEFKPYITDDMTDEDKEQRMKEFIDEGIRYIHERVDRLDRIIIQNSNGDIFYPTFSNYDDSEIRYSYDGIFHYQGTLDLTQYDLTDTLTLSFTIHTIDEDKNVVIKLQKEN